MSERGPTVLVLPIGAFIPSYSGAQGRAVLYDSIVYQNNTISPSVFPAPSPSEEVGDMNTKLFSKVKIFRVWIDDKITENKLASLFSLQYTFHLWNYTFLSYSPTGSDR